MCSITNTRPGGRANPSSLPPLRTTSLTYISDSATRQPVATPPVSPLSPVAESSRPGLISATPTQDNILRSGVPGSATTSPHWLIRNEADIPPEAPIEQGIVPRSEDPTSTLHSSLSRTNTGGNTFTSIASPTQSPPSSQLQLKTPEQDRPGFTSDAKIPERDVTVDSSVDTEAAPSDTMVSTLR